MSELLRFQAFAQKSYTTDYWNNIILEFADYDETLFNSILDKLNSALMLESEWQSFLNGNVLANANAARVALNAKTNEGNTLEVASRSRFQTNFHSFPPQSINTLNARFHIHPPSGYHMNHLYDLKVVTPTISARDIREPGQGHKNEVVHVGDRGRHKVVYESLRVHHEILATIYTNTIFVHSHNRTNSPYLNKHSRGGVLTVWRKP